MIAMLLAELGQGLYKNDRLFIPLGCEPVSAIFEFVIDTEGNLLGVRDVEKKDSRIISPMALVNGVISATGCGLYTFPNLLFARKQVLLDTDWKEIYKKNLESFYEKNEHTDIGSVLSFLGKDIPDILFDKYPASSYFRYVIREADTERRLDADERLIRAASDFFMETLHEQTGSDICDITGRVGTVTDKNIRLNNSSMSGTKLIGRAAYQSTGGGKHDNGHLVLSISQETDVYATAAFYMVLNNTKIFHPYFTHQFYFGTADGTVKFPVILSLRMIGRYCDTGFSSKGDWQQFQISVLKNLSGKSLIFVDYTWPDRGRISAFQARKFNKEESFALVKNIFRWIDLTVSWDDKDLPDIPGLVNTYKNRYGKDQETVNRNILRQFERIIHGRFEDAFREYRRNDLMRFWDGDQKRRIEWFVFCAAKEAGMMEGQKNTYQYKAGELYAWAEILEQRYQFMEGIESATLVRKLKEQYLKSPYSTWIKIRPVIERYSGSRPERYARYMSMIRHISWELSKDHIFEDLKNIGGTALYAIDITKETYWNDTRKEDDDENE